MPSKWRDRPAYRFVAETTVYIRQGDEGKGIGSLLYTDLLRKLKLKHFHAAIGCITLPNPASVTLHEKLGFANVAHFREVGFKFDQWQDVGFWQLMF